MYDVSSLNEFREQLVNDVLSAEELHERRNVITTWEAVNTDLGLVKHALQMYEDVVELSSSPIDSRGTHQGEKGSHLMLTNRNGIQVPMLVITDSHNASRHQL